MMFGLLFSLKRFAERMSPNENKVFYSYKTGTYKLHCFETITGLRFILCTDKGVGNIIDDLKDIFSKVYVPYVVRSPVYEMKSEIKSSLFEDKLDEFITKLKYY